MEIFRDPLWQFVGVVTGLIAVFLTGYQIYQYIKNQSKKSLVYRVNSSLPLVDIAKEAANDIRVTYQNREVVNLYLISLQVINNGNQPIRKEDFDENVCFRFGDRSTLISAEIVSSDPKSLTPKLSVENNEIVLTPLLLNEGDTFEVKVLVTMHSNENINYFERGRIIGVKEIINITDTKTNISRAQFVLLSASIIFTTLFLFFSGSFYLAYVTPLEFANLLLPTAIAFALVCGVAMALLVDRVVNK